LRQIFLKIKTYSMSVSIFTKKFTKSEDRFFGNAIFCLS
jgi:hypothetical protein